jgi:hypothetical protein
VAVRMNGHFSLYSSSKLSKPSGQRTGAIENRLHLPGIKDLCQAAVIGRDRRFVVDNHHEDRS